MSNRVHFGICLPQFAASWNQAREVAQAADEAGLDSVWCVDHLVGIFEREGPFEAWTEISAVAAITRRVRLGHLVLCVTFRPPALLAKMAATLDIISGGRLIVGLGAGWHEPEATMYGYDFPSIGTRLGQLGESCELLRRMWTEERTTFAGRHFRTNEVVCEPKPAQARLPILIGGGGERVTLRIVAEHADIWNGFGPAEEFGRKNAVLNRWCERVGRDPASIERSVLVNQPGDIDRISEFAAAGAQHLIVPARAPFDLAELKVVLAQLARET